MATGASTADVAILLIDARNGVRTQSRRHAQIARLLGITDFVLAINKMDLVDFDQEVYEKIQDDFSEFLAGASVHAIPMSALDGDNVIDAAARARPWFDGPPLLEYPRERAGPSQRRRRAVPLPGAAGAAADARVPRLCRADRVRHDQRRRPHHRLAVRPHAPTSGASSPTTAISQMAFAPMSVTLTLDDEIDISRGDVLTVEPACVGQQFEAEVVWMDERPLDPARVYLLKHSTRTVSAEVSHQLVLNQIGNVTVTTARPIVFDRYADNRGTGSFILIDPATHFTCGAGMITEPIRQAAGAAAAPLTAAQRIAHIARRAASDEEAAEAVRQALEEMLT